MYCKFGTDPFGIIRNAQNTLVQASRGLSAIAELFNNFTVEAEDCKKFQCTMTKRC